MHWPLLRMLCSSGGTADTRVSDARGRKVVEVQLLSRALHSNAALADVVKAPG